MSSNSFFSIYLLKHSVMFHTATTCHGSPEHSFTALHKATLATFRSKHLVYVWSVIHQDHVVILNFFHYSMFNSFSMTTRVRMSCTLLIENYVYYISDSLEAVSSYQPKSTSHKWYFMAMVMATNYPVYCSCFFCELLCCIWRHLFVCLIHLSYLGYFSY